MRQVLTFLAALASASAIAGTVEVRFIEPDRFSDIRDNHLRREQVLDVLAERLKRLGQAGLPAGQTLTIDVLDVDLAGELQPRVSPGDLRVLRGGADWPRVHLRYTLREGERVLQSGEERLADMAYQQSALPAAGDEPFPYEKRLLERWFAQRFAPLR